MQFLFPTFLFALFAIAIPIIIHLFHFRRFKTVYFTNVRFLKEVKEESNARAKIRNWLVLMARILAITFMVFAFAQPFIPQKDSDVKQGLKVVSIFVDNSHSMSSLSQDVTLLEKARLRAKEIVEAYDVEDEFQILTNDFEGRHQRLVSRDDALGLIDEVKITPAVKELSKVFSRQKQALSSSTADHQVAYVISDFQKNITDITSIEDTTIELTFIPLQSVEQQNISIDSCWFEAPVQMINQTNALVVKLRNLSDQDKENVRLTLKLDGQVKPLGNINIPARSEAYDTVNLTILRTGWHEAELSITDYPVNFDDDYAFSFNVNKDINLLVINDATQTNKYFNAVSSLPSFNVVNESSSRLDYSKIPSYQLIIVNEVRNISSGLAFELKQYAQNGGNLLIFPHAQASITSYNGFLKGLNVNEFTKFDNTERSVIYINTEEFVFKDVFANEQKDLTLPITKGNFIQTRYGSRQEEVLLRYRDGNSYIGKYKLGKGNVYLSSAPLDGQYNDLIQNNISILIPMLSKMAISTSGERKIANIIGRDNLIEADGKVASSELLYKLKGKDEEFIPEQKVIGSKVLLGLNNQVQKAGFYSLFLGDDTEEKLSTFAFNYDRKESELDYFTQEELKALGGNLVDVVEGTGVVNFAEKIGERNKGWILWKWCIIIALIFLGVETLLLRFWKI